MSRTFPDPDDDAHDLLRFARALTAGRLLGPAFTDVVVSGKVPLPPGQPMGPRSQSAFYGYGWFHTVAGGQRIIGHPGNSAGAATSIRVYPDLDWVSIVLSNYDVTIDPILEFEQGLITESV